MPDIPNQPYEIVVEADVMVRLRDGVRLATDLHRPARDGTAVAARFPVILERTPYGKSQASRSESRAEIAACFVRHGYVVIYQDCRGRHGSEGEFVKYLSDAEDGIDTIAWILDQPWCDGRIGTMGLSYAAHTQMALASLGPKGLAAMVVDCGGFSNAYASAIRQGGAFEMRQVTWAYNQAKESPPAKADPIVRAALDAEDIKVWFKSFPWKPGHSPVRHVPEYEAYLFDLWSRGTFDAYWKQPGLYATGYHDRMPDIPQVHMSSWYDPYVRTATENFLGLRTKKKKASVRLIMGPWLHGDRSSSFSGDVDFGARAPLDGNLAVNWNEFRRRWFDRWLKDLRNGVDEEPSVRLFLMGGGSGRRNAAGRLDHGGKWIAASDWPLPKTRFTPYYLHGDGRLASRKPRKGARPLSYDYDPARPCPTIGGSNSSGQPVFEGGAFDQREDPRFFGIQNPGLPLAARSDVLVFETEPLAEDVAVIGPITVRLWISSSSVDTDFTAKLIDVHPPTPDDPSGFAMNLTDGILRCRYRRSWTKPSMMTPGRVYAITIEPFATGNLFKAGHRIRLDVSSSNFPRFDVNPNSGEPEGMARLRRIATNTVHVDGGRPSHVVLPIVPVASLTPLG
jgi:putative CocE/NonD family hydrolase